MKAFFFLPAVLIFTAIGNLHAAPEKKDPIDVALDRAEKKDPSTLGMVTAFSDADEKWQKEIDRALAKLKKEMSEDQWKALQASQTAWKAYRDAEFETQGAIYAGMEGSMWKPVAAKDEMELDKSRAMLLRKYLGVLSEQ